MRARALQGVVLAVALGGSSVACAQSPAGYCHPRSMTVQELSEKALIDALDIGPLADAESGRLPYPKCPAGGSSGTPLPAGRVWIELRFRGSASANLDVPSRRALKKLAAALQSDRLAGFAFKVHAPVDHGANLVKRADLSKRRVRTVVDVLAREHALRPDRLTHDPAIEADFAESRGQWQGGASTPRGARASVPEGLFLKTVRVPRR